MHNYRTREANRRISYVPQPNLEYFKRRFIYVGPNIWNNIPNSIRNVNSIQSFEKRMKEYLNNHIGLVQYCNFKLMFMILCIYNVFLILCILAYVNFNDDSTEKFCDEFVTKFND